MGWKAKALFHQASDLFGRRILDTGKEQVQRGGKSQASFTADLSCVEE
jgi:hypothetical protein